jgi:hypothetical protein
MMLTIMKDYNHNDSKLFRYLPVGISQVKLTDKEKELVNLFIETSTNSVHSLEETETEASKVS